MPSKLTKTLYWVFAGLFITACTGANVDNDGQPSSAEDNGKAPIVGDVVTVSSVPYIDSGAVPNDDGEMSSSQSSSSVPAVISSLPSSSSSSEVSSSVASTPAPETFDFTGQILPAKQCESTASCRTTFGAQASDCQDSKSETSRCLCGQDTCGELFDAQSLVYAINVGGKSYTDKKGFSYVADFGAIGLTKVSSRPATSFGKTEDDELYIDQRYAKNLTYELPVTEGTYNVTLKLAESNFTDAGKRVFDLYAEGEVVVSNLDMYANDGSNAKDYTIKDVLVSDGNLTIKGNASVNNATVAAIVVTSTTGLPTCDTTCMNEKSEALFAEPTQEEPTATPPKEEPTATPPKEEPSNNSGKPTLYKNDLNVNSDLNSLAIRKGASNNAIVSYNEKGRRGKGLQITHKKSSKWLATLGAAKLSKTVEEATLSYSVFIPSDWQYRLQGKLPGLAPIKPHFGGSKNDSPVWNSWSVRLMWISSRNNVSAGKDDLAVPSIYVYDQKRQKGKTGTHYRVNSFKMPKNEWLDVTITVKLNTYNNKTARSDGSVELKINGKTIEKITGLKLRGNVATIADKEKTKIHNVAFHNYYGGSKEGLDVPTKSSTKIIFDNIRVTQ